MELYMLITKCKEINELIDSALKKGNSVLEMSDSWSKMDLVIYMSKPISLDFKEKYRSFEHLEYYETKGSPHDKPDEGFYCQRSKISVSFPQK